MRLSIRFWDDISRHHQLVIKINQTILKSCNSVTFILTFLLVRYAYPCLKSVFQRNYWNSKDLFCKSVWVSHPILMSKIWLAMTLKKHCYLSLFCGLSPIKWLRTSCDNYETRLLWGIFDSLDNLIVWNNFTLENY